jgi:hypothetical protein
VFPPWVFGVHKTEHSLLLLALRFQRRRLKCETEYSTGEYHQRDPTTIRMKWSGFTDQFDIMSFVVSIEVSTVVYMVFISIVSSSNEAYADLRFKLLVKG